jgi:hypothetical protein
LAFLAVSLCGKGIHGFCHLLLNNESVNKLDIQVVSPASEHQGILPLADPK